MPVSLILTVLNEGEAIRPLLDSLCQQTRPPDEVVVADGGSTDDTVAILREYAARLNLRVVDAPGANISQGRNAAIRAAMGEVIAVTDAGVVCEEEWLERLTKPLRGNPDTGTSNFKTQTSNSRAQSPVSTFGQSPPMAAGFFVSDPRTPFEIAMGATVLPLASEINPATYLPSSRSVAFLKSAWEAVGGYPEWLDYSEDVLFDIALKKRFGPFVFVPDAVVHFRPRSSLRAFFRQYYNYARGDGKARLFTRLHLIRYFTYWIALPLGVYAALTVSPWLWAVGALAGLAYLRRPLLRLRGKMGGLSLSQRLYILALVPVIRVVGDVAKMLGWPVGMVWRQRM